MATQHAPDERPVSQSKEPTMNHPARAEQTESDEVLYEVAEGIAVITLNAPERMNTISGPTFGCPAV